uniref:Uncharacterized protein n=1 Tax=Anguilla anguilla TaxID=7936 RepID=A0A0E9RIF0_ANGAN
MKITSKLIQTRPAHYHLYI